MSKAPENDSNREVLIKRWDLKVSITHLSTLLALQ